MSGADEGSRSGSRVGGKWRMSWRTKKKKNIYINSLKLKKTNTKKAVDSKMGCQTAKKGLLTVKRGVK